MTTEEALIIVLAMAESLGRRSDNDSEEQTEAIHIVRAFIDGGGADGQ